MEQDYVIKILASNEISDGMITQELYTYLTEQVSETFNLSLKQAKRIVSSTLKQLYVIGA